MGSLPDNAKDRLKQALILGDANESDGAPELRVQITTAQANPGTAGPMAATAISRWFDAFFPTDTAEQHGAPALKVRIV